MSARIACAGRLGADPVSRETRNGKAMTTARLAVDLSDGRAGVKPAATWFDIVAFDRAANDLGRLAKGDSVSVSGALRMNVWTGADCEERQSMQIICADVIGARLAKTPAKTTGKRSGPQHGQPGLRPEGRPAEAAASAPFHNDEIPF